jgi:hypothetical protein
MPLSTIFSYIMAVRFIGGGNQRTRRKLPTCVTDKLYHIMLYKMSAIFKMAAKTRHKNGGGKNSTLSDIIKI